MNLKEFTPDNCITGRSSSRVPSIGINTKVGMFRLNLEATELVGLKDGDQVKFHQDEDEPTNWYLEKVKEGGFVLRHKEAVGNGLLFNNMKLAKQIAESVSFTEKSGKCLLAGVPTQVNKRQLFGIITGTLRSK